MSAAKAVADHCTLTGNSHQMNPVLGQTSGWNPYFDMFSQEDLSSISEVLLWKQYNLSIGYTTMQLTSYLPVVTNWDFHAATSLLS